MALKRDEIAVDPQPPKTRTRRARLRPWFIANLAVLLVIVIGSAAWLTGFTDWVRTVQDWLKVLGVTAVAGAAFQLVGKVFGEKLEPLRDLLAKRGERILDSRRLFVALLGFLAVEVFLIAPVGAVWANGQKDKRVWWYDAQGLPLAPVLSQVPEKPLREPYRTGFGERRVMLRFEGFPPQSTTLRPMRLSRVSPAWAPAAPLAVVRCTGDPLVGSFQLRIARTPPSGPSESFTIAAYRGEPVILGCDADLILPERFKHLATRPLRTPDGGPVTIRPGDTLSAKLTLPETAREWPATDARVGQGTNGTFDEVHDVEIKR